jgi:hypothetical protein
VILFYHFSNGKNSARLKCTGRGHADVPPAIKRQPGAGAGCARLGELLDLFTDDIDTKDLKKAKASLDELQALTGAVPRWQVAGSRTTGIMNSRSYEVLGNSPPRKQEKK